MHDTNVFQLDFSGAYARLKDVVKKTPLTYNHNLSRKYGCDVYLKREDLQIVRSYKLRGAYNMMSLLPSNQLAKGVVCASAGNHAQGFAYSCKKLNVQGVVFMPIITPNQKVSQTKMFGEGFVEVKLVGDTFDDCAVAAKKYTEERGLTFIPPFDNIRIIEGQSTVGIEILEEQQNIDFIFLPVGGGGLSAGVGAYFKTYAPATKIIGVEPEGAPSMLTAIKAGEPVKLDQIDSFVDGAAVKQVGEKTYSVCKDTLSKIVLVPEGKVCSTILSLYNEEAIVVEPAGSLSVAALDFYKDEIKGKRIVCVVSGSNNDIDRMQEIKERSMIYEGLKHFFIIRFPQRPGALKDFVSKVLGPDDDITRFEYVKKNARESGPAMIGVELKHKEDYLGLLERMKQYGINYTVINDDPSLFQYFV